MAWLLEPGLGLAAFIAARTRSVRLQIDWPAVGVVAATVLVVVVVMVARQLVARPSARAEPGAADR